MIPDRDVWQAAVLMVKHYDSDAMFRASARTHRLLEDGDWQGAETWHRILNAIERFQAKAPRSAGTGHARINKLLTLTQQCDFGR
jgi:hypothetical protein